MVVPAFLMAPTLGVIALLSIGYNQSEETHRYPNVRPPVVLTHRKTEYLYGEPTHEVIVQTMHDDTGDTKLMSLARHQQWMLRMKARLMGKSGRTYYVPGVGYVSHRCFLDEQHVTQELYPALKAQYERDSGNNDCEKFKKNQLYLNEMQTSLPADFWSGQREMLMAERSDA